MTSPAFFGTAVDSLFNRLGVDAVYLPNGGGNPVNIKIIAKQPDEIFGVADTIVHSESNIFDVKVADILTPRAGDQIQIGTDILTVHGEPNKDLHGRIWKLEAYKTNQI